MPTCMMIHHGKATHKKYTIEHGAYVTFVSAEILLCYSHQYLGRLGGNYLGALRGGGGGAVKKKKKISLVQIAI